MLLSHQKQGMYSEEGPFKTASHTVLQIRFNYDFPHPFLLPRRLIIVITYAKALSQFVSLSKRGMM